MPSWALPEDHKKNWPMIGNCTGKLKQPWYVNVKQGEDDKKAATVLTKNIKPMSRERSKRVRSCEAGDD